VQSRIDPTVDFNWGEGLVTNFGRDYVSVRWTGKLVHPEGREEDVTLYLSGNEGFRLYFDHALVIDRWDTCCQDQRANVHLSSGVLHDVVIEYREERGSASISFEISSASLPKQVVPPTALHYATHVQGSPYLVNIVPGAADFPFTTAFGQGILEAAAGVESAFFI